MKFRFPYPVSANRYWRSFVPRGHQRAVVVLSDEAKSYKSEVGWLAKQQGCGSPTKKPVELHVRLIPKNGIVMDLDNCLKVSIDALKTIVYADDRQVRRIVAEYGEPDGSGALEVEVREYLPPAPGLFNEERMNA